MRAETSTPTPSGPSSAGAPNAARRRFRRCTARSPFAPARPLGRRALVFLGPGYLVAVGYMDPGNWATSLAGGSRFGYTLLFAALVSSVMAIILQALCARLAVATGRDLAQACRDSYSPAGLLQPLGARRACHRRDRSRRGDRHRDRPEPPLRHPARIRRHHHRARRLPRALSAEQGLPLDRGLHHHAASDHRASASWRSSCWRGRRSPASSAASFRGPRSSPIPTCSISRSASSARRSCRTISTSTRRSCRPAPMARRCRRSARRSASPRSIPPSRFFFALMINASILILAAASFHARGEMDVEDLGQAHSLLMPLLGAAAAPVLFAIALLCCGLSSTVTATMAGQAVMEGFLRHAARALAPPPHHPRPRHRAGGGRHHLRRRCGRGEAPDLLARWSSACSFPSPSCRSSCSPPTAQDGRLRLAALADARSRS